MLARFVLSRKFAGMFCAICVFGENGSIYVGSPYFHISIFPRKDNYENLAAELVVDKEASND